LSPAESEETALRAAGAEDLGLLLDFIRGLYAAEHISFDEDRAARALGGLLEEPSPGWIWIVERRGEPVGYAVVTLGYSLEFGGRFALLDELFIAESHRGAGVGRQVLDRIAEVCREMRLQAVRLEVERANEAACGLYRRAGFVAHDRDLMTLWLDGGE
jgi:ribosomal protein S18 acetylase RimI-like enzyme